MRKSDIAKLQSIISAERQRERNASAKKRKHKKSVRVFTQGAPHHVPKQRRTFDNLIKSSMFRFLNEKLYSCTSKEAQSLFSDDPQAFRIYHDGFQQQLSQWPNDPQLWIADYIKSQKKELKKCRVADMGCGDARLVSLLGEDFKVYSFDLVAINENVTVCDMAHTPTKSSHVHFVVFCLSLMGTNCRDFLIEANRILKMGGELLIVEVASRFDGKIDPFLEKLTQYGFRIDHKEVTEDTYFVQFRLRKIRNITAPAATLPRLELKACLYKKR